MTRRLLVLTIALSALCAPSAGAATICVPTSAPGCDSSSATLSAAVTAAGGLSGRDTIRLAPGYTSTQSVTVGAANVVDIAGGGRGPGGTVLLQSASTIFALDIQSPGSTVSNLRVEIGPVGGGENGIALSAAGVVADGITVVGSSGSLANVNGVQLRNGSILRNSLIEVPATSSANYAINAEEDTLVENVSAAGDAMISARDPGPPVVVRRLRSTSASQNGALVSGAASLQISDSLIRLSGGSSSTGLSVETSGANSPSILARNLTVVGSGSPANAGVGAFAGGYDAGQSATVNVSDSIFHALSTDVEVDATAGQARAQISHSNFDPAKVLDTGGGDAALIAGAGNLLVNPGFVDGAAADFRLRSDSALIDRGSAGAGSPADLDGLARVTDGNGDGLAVRDIGAFEYQRPVSPGPAPDTSSPLFRILSKRLRLDRRGRVAVVLRGPANELAPSRASVGLRRNGRRLGRKSLSLRPSARTVVRVKLSRRVARRVRRAQRMRISLAVTARDSAGNARTVRKVVRLRASRL